MFLSSFGETEGGGQRNYRNENVITYAVNLIMFGKFHHGG